MLIASTFRNVILKIEKHSCDANYILFYNSWMRAFDDKEGGGGPHNVCWLKKIAIKHVCELSNSNHLSDLKVKGLQIIIRKLLFFYNHYDYLDKSNAELVVVV